jgi:hypothetical protein
MGKDPSLHIQKMHTSFITLLKLSLTLIAIHGSHKVDTRINHLKIKNKKQRHYIMARYIYQAASRTGCINPEQPFLNGCIQNSCPGGAPPDWRHNHIRVHWMARGITYRKEAQCVLLKIISLGMHHIAHKRAQMPTLV